MESTENNESMIAWLPDLIYTGGRFERGQALVCDPSGQIASVNRVDELRDEKRIRLAKRAMLPGMVNAHSHAFQRVLRGRSEYRASNKDNFWTWREMMYSAATRLTPEDIYDASRMAFLEMALNGITAVGEFHYLHHDPDGHPYDDPNLLAKEVVRAAGDVGLRIALLRVAYARAGFQAEPNPKQARFIEKDPDSYLKNVERLIADVNRGTSPAVREGSLSFYEKFRSKTRHAATYRGDVGLSRRESGARCARFVRVIQSIGNYAHAGPDSGAHWRPGRLGFIDREGRRNLEQFKTTGLE